MNVWGVYLRFIWTATTAAWSIRQLPKDRVAVYPLKHRTTHPNMTGKYLVSVQYVSVPKHKRIMKSGKNRFLYSTWFPSCLKLLHSSWPFGEPSVNLSFLSRTTRSSLRRSQGCGNWQWLNGTGGLTQNHFRAIGIATSKQMTRPPLSLSWPQK